MKEAHIAQTGGSGHAVGEGVLGEKHSAGGEHGAAGYPIIPIRGSNRAWCRRDIRRNPSRGLRAATGPVSAWHYGETSQEEPSERSSALQVQVELCRAEYRYP